MLPLEGNVHQMGRSIMYFETGINSGIERKRTDFKKGDIAFLPTEGSICFYMDDISDGKPMTIIGKITDGINKLSETKSSDILSLSRNWLVYMLTAKATNSFHYSIIKQFL